MAASPARLSARSLPITSTWPGLKIFECFQQKTEDIWLHLKYLFVCKWLISFEIVYKWCHHIVMQFERNRHILYFNEKLEYEKKIKARTLIDWFKIKRKTEKPIIWIIWFLHLFFFTSSEFDGRSFSKLIINLTQKIDCTSYTYRKQKTWREEIENEKNIRTKVHR